MNHKRLWLLIGLFLVLLLPGLVHAQTQQSSSSQTSFIPQVKSVGEIPATDVSTHILTQVFGPVGNVLVPPPGNQGSNILSSVIYYFNYAALALAMVFVLYVTIVSILNTAQEGQALGEKFNSLWIPLRIVAGIALMLPVHKAYTVGQILVMWVLLQGVNGADIIWAKTVKNIESGVLVISSGNPYYESAANVFVSYACAARFSIQLHAEQPNIYCTDGQKGCAGETTSGVYQLWNKNGQTFFGWGLSNLQGSVKYNTSQELPFGIPSSGKVSSSKYYQTVCGLMAGQDYSPGANPDAVAAGIRATNNLVHDSNLSFTGMEFGEIGGTGPSLGMIEDQARTAINNAANQMYLMMKPYQTPPPSTPTNATPKTGIQCVSSATTAAPGSSSSQLAQYLQNAPCLGWALAGAYYLGVSRSAQLSYAPWVPQYFGPYIGDTLTQGSTESVQFVVNAASEFAMTAANTLAGGGQSIPIPDSLHATERRALKPWATNLPNVVAIFNNYIETTANQWATLSFAQDPTSALISAGAQIEHKAQTIWAAMLASIGVISFLAALGIGFGIMTAIMMSLAWYLPIMWATLSVAIVSGVMFEIYIPLIPFLLFSFGVLGWLVLCIEAIIAAPIMSLGLIYPEQHQVWGRSEQGIFILISACLRPILMIVGLLAAIPVTYAVVGFINMGFMIILYALASGVGGDVSKIVVFWPMTSMLYMSIYTMIIVSTYNRIFSLIHILPDKVMRWIGVAEERGYGGEQELQQLQGGIKESAQAGARLAQESTEGEASAAREAGAQVKEAGEKAATGGM